MIMRLKSLPAIPRIKSYKTEKLIRSTVFTLLLVAVSIVVIIPFVWLVITSLKPDMKSVYVFPPEWIPRNPTWSNYLKAWQSAPFDRYLLNSLIVSVSGMVLQLTNACLCAYIFSRINFKGRAFLFTMFMAVMMIPSQVTVIPNYVILSSFGMLNTYWALILPSMATAFGTFLIRQAFLSIPNDLVDAAVIDGANHPQILRHVMIPLSMPMIITFAMLVFNWRWNDYFWVLIMTTSNEMRTMPVGLVAMRAGSEGGAQWQILMAATVIVIAPVMILFAFAQRYFIEGIARTGLAGQ
jgi:ABC-type glycerol-3-phosphate transport system permease component